jgi:ubiquitin carboxyl-terminal hydrolase 5/13
VKETFFVSIFFFLPFLPPFQNGNMERAVEFLFSHADAMVVDEVVEQTELHQVSQDPRQHQQAVDSKPARYELTDFIVHLGASTHSGHYVAYIRKNNQWIQFNDRKVMLSEKPPIGGAYLLFFQRK